MATLALVISLAALLISTSAQDDNVHVWSSVAYLHHGEQSPKFGGLLPTLSTVGAQQMFAQGSMIRARYLGERLASPYAPIQGIERDALDNSQLLMLSSDDAPTISSAQAFLQGLYPPDTQAFAEGNGGMGAAEIAGGSLVTFPLGGYQYPRIQTLSSHDPNHLAVEGNADCAQYLDAANHVSDDSNMLRIYNQTLIFYRNLYYKFFADVVSYNIANFYSAYDLWAYAAYQYAHNNGSHAQITTDELAQLAHLAAIQQGFLNGNLSLSGAAPGDRIRAIAGRTLAASVLSQFEQQLKPSGSHVKLSLLFGSYEPFLSFFALSNLVDGPSAAIFQTLPNPGAVMLFEMFSSGGNTSSLPDAKDLWVRFLYRNSTDTGVPLIAYPLFGYGNAQTQMRYSDFVTAMQSIAIDLLGWCDSCATINLFCQALQDNSSEDPEFYTTNGGSVSQGPMTPAVAGIIGATMSIAVLAFTAAACLLLGGYRFRRVGGDDKHQLGSTIGGFKGAEKMASDTDLAYVNGGARHERHGSWELRSDGKRITDGTITETTDTPVTIGAVILNDTARQDVKPTAAFEDDDDASIMEHAPVNPRESV